MMRTPWATHFGFTKLPFSKNVSAKDLLDRASHQEAVARIRFCIAEALLGVITGEVGVGKTRKLSAVTKPMPWISSARRYGFSRTKLAASSPYASRTRRASALRAM